MGVEKAPGLASGVVAEAWYKEEILAMPSWITALGGVLIMKGQHSKGRPDCFRLSSTRKQLRLA